MKVNFSFEKLSSIQEFKFLGKKIMSETEEIFQKKMLTEIQTVKIYNIFSERCNLDCGSHGSCESGRCVCEPGWQGDVCSVKTCDPRCSAHGMCSNGTCLCTNGKLERASLMNTNTIWCTWLHTTVL